MTLVIMHSASDSCKRDVVSGRSHECPLVALTGATGLIGRHLLKELPKRGYKIRVLLRRPTMLPPEASGAVVGDLAAPATCRTRSQALTP